MTVPDFGAPRDGRARDAAAVPLRELLRATPRLAPERAAALVGGIGRALIARGVPYGALTPERVLVAPDDRVTLAPPPRPDVGPAPWPAYLAPEQIDGRAADARSDVYALGLVGWEMLAGRQPWDGESLYGIVVKQREQDLPRLSTLRPGLPRPLVQAIEGALHKAPDDRWQSAAEVLNVLGPLGGRAAPLATPPVGGAASAYAAAPPPPTYATPPVVGPAGRAASTVGDDDLDEDADAAEPRRARAPRAAAAPAPRRRWLTVTALALATLAAGAGAFAVVQGRQDSSETRAWLDSVTASTGGTGAAAVEATTTRENTTSAPVRRTGGGRAERSDDDPELPDPDAPAEAIGDTLIGPTPPFVPAPPVAPGRPIRPTVPRDTAARPDTIAPPDSLR